MHESRGSSLGAIAMLGPSPLFCFGRLGCASGAAAYPAVQASKAAARKSARLGAVNRKMGKLTRPQAVAGALVNREGGLLAPPIFTPQAGRGEPNARLLNPPSRSCGGTRWGGCGGGRGGERGA